MLAAVVAAWCWRCCGDEPPVAAAAPRPADPGRRLAANAATGAIAEGETEGPGLRAETRAMAEVVTPSELRSGSTGAETLTPSQLEAEAEALGEAPAADDEFTDEEAGDEADIGSAESPPVAKPKPEVPARAGRPTPRKGEPQSSRRAARAATQGGGGATVSAPAKGEGGRAPAPRAGVDPRPAARRAAPKPAAEGAAAAAKPAAKKPAKAAAPAADDLKQIKGVGKRLEGLLHGLGVTSFAQIAGWSDADVARIGEAMGFPGRIERDGWIEQARTLAAGGETDFAARVKKGDVY